MKNALIKLSGLSIFICTVGFAEIPVGNGAFQLDTSLMGVYDSNLRDSASEISDYYLSFDPTLRYRRLGSRFNTEAQVGLRARRYMDHPIYNSNDADASFNWGMQRVDGHTTAAALSLHYTEYTEAVLDVNERVRTKAFNASTSGEVLVADRNLLSAGISYRDNQHDIGSDQKSSSARMGYSFIGFTDGTALNFNYLHQQNKSTENTVDMVMLDQKAETVSVGVTHPIYDQLTSSLTYGYRWLDRGAQEARLGLINRQGTFYAISFDGPFLPRKYFPKTTASFRISYEQAEAPGLNDPSNKRLVGQMNISWAVRETTTLAAFASRSQDLTINDNTVVNEVVGVSLRQAVGSFIETNFSLRYTYANFVNLVRSDDRYEARAGATYKINRAWSSGATYSFLKSESNVVVANFRRHLVTATLTYAF